MTQLERDLNAEGQPFFLAELWSSASPEEQLSLYLLCSICCCSSCTAAEGLASSSRAVVLRVKEAHLQAPGTWVSL